MTMRDKAEAFVRDRIIHIDEDSMDDVKSIWIDSVYNFMADFAKSEVEAAVNAEREKIADEATKLMLAFDRWMYRSEAMQKFIDRLRSNQ